MFEAVFWSKDICLNVSNSNLQLRSCKQSDVKWHYSTYFSQCCFVVWLVANAWWLMYRVQMDEKSPTSNVHVAMALVWCVAWCRWHYVEVLHGGTALCWIVTWWWQPYVEVLHGCDSPMLRCYMVVTARCWSVTWWRCHDVAVLQGDTALCWHVTWWLCHYVAVL